MRKLEINDPAGSEAVHAAIKQTLAATTFRFEPDWARTITGDEEGVYGWVALNYQQVGLRTHVKPLIGPFTTGELDSRARHGH